MNLETIEQAAGPATRPRDTPEQAMLRRLAEVACWAVTVPPPGARLSRRQNYREFMACLGAAAELL